MKTGYKVWQDDHGTSTRVVESEGWSKLWKTDVPKNKIKVFLWRFCRNNITVKILLRGRGVQTPIICSMCSDIVHMFHLFFYCSFAAQCWNYMGLQFAGRMRISASEWLINFISSATQEEIVKVATILWGIWRARNLLVWENKVVTPPIAMGWVANQVTEWKHARLQ